jgi:hypothetical protein
VLTHPGLFHHDRPKGIAKDVTDQVALKRGRFFSRCPMSGPVERLGQLSGIGCCPRCGLIRCSPSPGLLRSKGRGLVPSVLPGRTRRRP